MNGSRRKRRSAVSFRKAFLSFAMLSAMFPVVAGEFNQTDWSGGSSAATALDPTNANGWTAYTSKDTGIAATSNLVLSADVSTLIQTSTADFSPAGNQFSHTTYKDFTSGVPDLENTKVNNGAVGLLPSTIVKTWARKTANAWDFNTSDLYNNPTFADLDNDGDMDMLVGNTVGNVLGYENVGSDENHVWTAVPAWTIDRKFIKNTYRSHAAPALGDFDNDGDADLFIGYNEATMYALENVGNEEFPQWVYKPEWDLNTGLGGAARGALVDLNGNGQLDMLVGGGWSEPRILAWQYNGSSWVRNASWEPEAHTVSNGYSRNQDVGDPNVADLDNDGDYDLLVGWRYEKTLTGFENSNANSPAWTTQDSNYYVDVSDISASVSYLTPGLVDLDSDGDFDILMGANGSSTMYGYENTTTTYNTSGAYTSTAIDLGNHAGFNSVVFSTVELSGTTEVKVDFRAGGVPVPDASWTHWQEDVASGTDMRTALGSRRYIQYRVRLSTIDSSVTPLFKEMTINYTAYPVVDNVTAAHNKVSLDVLSRTFVWENDPNKDTNRGPWSLALSSGQGPDNNFKKSKPVLGDLDGDGHLDLLLGDEWTNVGIGGYKNNGANSWTYQSSWNVTGLSGNNFPGLADIDGDGDQDAFVNNGTNVIALRNDDVSGGDTVVSGPKWVAHAAWDIPAGASGANADFADLDNDGDLDAMVGYVGTLSNVHKVMGYQNITNDIGAGPVWVAHSAWDYVGSSGNQWTKVPRLVDIDNDGDHDMFVGDTDGSYDVVENIGNAETPLWSNADSSWFPPSIPDPCCTGNQTGFSEFADIDGDGDYDLLRGGSGSYAVISRYNQSVSSYPASGTYYSGVLDFGGSAYTTLTYTANIRTGTNLTIDLRGGDTLNPNDGNWSAWSTGLSSGADISVFTGNRYLQYRVTMNANGAKTLTPELLDVSINYSGLVSESELISSPYDTTNDPNYVAGVAWQETLASNSDIRLQLRTAPNNADSPGVWSPWMGPDGTTNGYWNSSNTHNGNCIGSGSVSCDAMPLAFRSGNDDRWLQYKVTLVANDVATPTFSDVTVSFTDTLSPGISVTPVSGLSTTEDFATASFNVVLDALPTNTVTIPVSSSDTSEGTVSTALLTFTTGNWNVSQPVTITGVNDDVDDNDVVYTIDLGAASSSDNDYNNMDPNDVTVTNTDNDTAGIKVTPETGLITTEAGTGTDTFTIVLESEPTADVTISLSSSDTTEGTLSHESITFDHTNWNSARVITVTAVDDGIDDGDIEYAIQTSAAVTADGKYYNMHVDDVQVTTVDDDTANLTVSPSSGLITDESGGTTSFDIRIYSEPVSEVIIGLASSNRTEGTLSANQIVFDNTNWQTPQTVTVTGVDDSQLDGDFGYVVITQSAISQDPVYDGWLLPNVSLTNTDNDSAGVIVTPTSGLETTEAGAAAMFGVRLSSNPSATVTVEFATSDPSEGSVSPSSVSFHSGDWMSTKLITVTGVDDQINDGDITFSIITSLSSSDPNYSGVNPADVSLNNINDDSGEGVPTDGFVQISWGEDTNFNEPTCTDVGGTWTGLECVAVDPENQAGWDSYSSKSDNMSVINAGSDLTLPLMERSLTHTSNVDFLPSENFITHTAYKAFAAGDTSDKTKVNNGAVGIKPAFLSKSWVANTERNYTVGDTYPAPTFGDLDGDGDLDMLVGFYTGETEAYINAGSDESPNWTFFDRWRVDRVIDGGVKSRTVPTLGDFDNDGDLDLFIGVNSTKIYGFLNIGNAYFPQWERKSEWDLTNIATSSSRGQLLHLNGDNQLDMLVGGIPRSEIFAFEYNTTSKTWSRNSDLEPPAHTLSNGFSFNRDTARVAAGDLDDDGDIDLLAGWRVGSVTVGYENKGSSTSPSWDNTFNISGLVSGLHTPAFLDYDSDGDLDVMQGEADEIFLRAYENNSTIYNSSGTYLSAVMDTGAHAGLDILNFTTHLPANTAITVDIRAGDVATPDGTWTAWVNGVANGDDISGLGAPRYVQYRANFSTSDTSVTPLLKEVEVRYVSLPHGSNVILAQGMLTMKALSRAINWVSEPAWNHDASSGSPPADSNNNDGIPSLGDLDGDGDLDLIRGDNWGKRVGLYVNDGNNNWIYNADWDLHFSASGEISWPRLVDIDNDGDQDVMMGHRTNIDAFENIGTPLAPVWQSGSPVLTNGAWTIYDVDPGNWTAADYADLDSDGDYDAMVSGSSGRVLAYENRGSAVMPSWFRNTAWDVTVHDMHARPALADIDGDGDFDLMVGKKDRSVIYAYENTGTAWEPTWGRKSDWDPDNAGGSEGTADFADLDNDGDMDMLLGDGTTVIKGFRNAGATTYASSGRYTSAVLDIGFHHGFTTLDYTAVIRSGTALTVDVRAGNIELPDGSWTAWQSSIADGGDISLLADNRYVQYRVNFTASGDNSLAPDLLDISFKFNSIVLSEELNATSFNTTSASSFITGLGWTESLPPGTNAQVQMRIASDNAGDPGVWSDWLGPDGTAASYWDSVNTFSGSCSGSGAIICTAIPAVLQNGIGAQWFQYKVTLVSEGLNAPTFSNIGISYSEAQSSSLVSVAPISGLTTSETEQTDTFDVVLTAQPSADVVIHLHSGDLSEVTLSDSVLTFTNSDWNQAQTVTVTGVNDAINDGDVSYTVYTSATFSHDASFDKRIVSDVTGNNVDDEAAGAGVSVTPTSGLTTTEAGGSASFSVVLTSVPSPGSEVMITLASDDNTEGTVSPNVMTFNDSNWSVSKTAIVTGVQDELFDQSVSYNIVTSDVASTDPSYDGMAVDDVAVINTNDDVADIVVSTDGALITSEPRGVNIFQIRLASKPTSDVTVYLSTSDRTEGVVSPFYMRFTTSDWDEEQSGTVFAVDDGEIDGSQMFDIVTSKFRSTDPNFDKQDPQDIPVTNEDNDGYSISVTPPSGLITSENGETAVFNFKLGARPTSDIIIPLSSSDSGEGTVPSQVIFTTDDITWRGISVFVTGVDDQEVDTDQPYTIITGAAISDDANYNGIDPDDVSVTNRSYNTLTQGFGQSGANIGRAVTFIGDVNGDGYDDMAVGAPNYQKDHTNEGRVDIHYGPVPIEGPFSNVTIFGGMVNAYLGHALSSAGDVNNDGYDDLLVGAYGASTGGVAYVYHGSENGIVTTPSTTIDLAQAGAGFGYSVAAAGNVNGDDYADIIVGAPNQDKAYIFHGADDGVSTTPARTLSGTQGSSQFGISVSSAGDADNDSYSDVVVGADLYNDGNIGEGGAFVYFGSASGVIATPDWIYQSDQDNANFGFAVSGPGDLDDDGFDDLLVGAPNFDNGHSNEGRAYVYYGGPRETTPAIGLLLEPNQTDAKFGSAISTATDFNKDGYADVIIGAPGYSNGESAEGRAFIYFGSAAGLTTNGETYESDQAGANLGVSVAGGGDFDNDGFGDVVVGANLYDGNAIDEGYVFFQRTAPSLTKISITPTSALVTSESGDYATFDIVLEAPPSDDVTVWFASSDPSEGMVSSTSYARFTSSNWDRPRTIGIQGVDDAITDGDVEYHVISTVTSNDADFDNAFVDVITLTNRNDDTSVFITASDFNVGETGSNSGEFTFTRVGPMEDALTVNYSVTGTAVNGEDFNGAGGAVIIPAGQAVATVTITPVDDAVAESSETITLNVLATSNYIVGSGGTASVTIVDNDAAGITVSPVNGLVTTEAGGMASFTVVLNTQPAASQTVVIDLSSDTPEEGLVSPTSLTFTDSNWSEPQSVSVVGQDDHSVDGDRFYTIHTAAAVSGDSGYNNIDADNVTVTNTDNDALPSVSIVASAATVDEFSSQEGMFEIQRTGPTHTDLIVDFGVSGSASSGLDYRPIGASVIIPAGSGSVPLAIASINDGLAEGDEDVVVALLSDSNYVVSEAAIATVIIKDDDAPEAPYANFSLDQLAGEGDSATVTVVLNETAFVYPVTIPYTVSGEADNPADHDAASGSIVISSGREGSVTFNIAADGGSGDPNENVIFTMGTPTNARVGARNTHIVTIIEDNEDPSVSFVSKQVVGDSPPEDVATSLIITNEGYVTVTATVDDPNPGDSHSFDWNATNNSLVDINDFNDATYVFDPSGLSPGFYKVRLTVSDNGTPVKQTTVDWLLELAFSAPVLTNADTDNDGLIDSAESYDDSDGDGIPDYKDASSLASHELQLDTSKLDSFIMQTDVGLTLRLGDVAQAAGSDGALVSVDDIASFGGGEGNAGSASAVDTVVGTGSYFDFEIIGLPKAGQSVRLVIPEQKALPAGASYRKYDPDLGWNDFVVDSNNAVASAPGLPGKCPPPGDPAYVNGLIEGYYCIQLTIEDGGDNDQDGLANHVIEDPAQVVELGRVVAEPTPVEPVPEVVEPETVEPAPDVVSSADSPSVTASSPESSSIEGSGGGGAIHMGWLVLLMLGVVIRASQIRRMRCC
ncbi:FG-GAP-like repeat-containing protein [Pseudomonadota bacterium]